MDCASCHDPSGWTTIKEVMLFNHDSTNFALEGSHSLVSCKDCHQSIVFSEASDQCISCHTDIHNMSVGNDCARCHTTHNWMIDNIPELHEENGFPLYGAHSNLSCIDCHTSETQLTFNRIGNDCINCHQDEYLKTMNPNHQLAGFSTNCLDCHDPVTNGWDANILGHEFFPLTAGHDIQDCGACHTTGIFSDASPACVSCHLDDYNATTSPNHVSSQFPTDCAVCHDITSWTSATLYHDALYFPIYSGKHNNEWSLCTDCHINNNDFSVFSCINCHEHNNQNEVDDKHDGVGGYVYNSAACFNCHPSGD